MIGGPSWVGFGTYGSTGTGQMTAELMLSHSFISWVKPEWFAS